MKFIKLNPRYNSAPIDDDRNRGLIVLNTVGSTPLVVSGFNFSGIGAIATAIVDGSGNQVTSFGGGTQYTDAAAAATHPIGTGIIFNNGGTYNFVSASQPLPVTGTVTANNSSIGATGAAVPSSATYLGFNSGGNLTALTLGQQLAAASLPIVLTAAQISTLTPLSTVAVTQSTSPWVVSNGGTFAVQATLSAETTKVIGVVRNADGSGNLLTSTGNALDINIKSGSIPAGTNSIGSVKLTDGTNTANVLAATLASNALSAQAAQIVATGDMEVAFTTTSVQAVASTDVTNFAWVSVQINSQGGSSTVTFQASNDNSTWVSTVLNSSANATGTPVSSTTGTGIFSGPLQGRYFRLNVTGIVSGTTAGTIEFSTLAKGMVNIGSALSANISTNLAQIAATTTLVGNGVTGNGSQRVTIASDNTGIANWGHGATASAVPSGATYEGLLAKTALPAAASDGNLTGEMGDKFGRQVVLLGSIRDLTGTQTTTLSATTSETTIVTAGASGVFNDLVMLIVSNTSAATNTRIDFRDTTGGSILFSLESIGGAAPVGFALPIPIPQTSSATNWTAQCATSTTDIRIYAVYVKNK